MSVEPLLEFIGRHYGNQRSYFVCAKCREEVVPDTLYGDVETVHTNCGGEIHVEIPNSEMLVIRWRAWKTNQKWLPQRMYALPASDESSYSYWQWVGREWRKREYGGLFGE